MRFIQRLGNSCCPIPGENIIVPDDPITPDDPVIPDGPNDNNYAWVEIGGLRWATMNIGAVNETDIGLYFQWGDTQGYTASQVGMGEGKKQFVWVDYKYGNGANTPGASDMTKYNSTDGKTVLDLEDDAARVNWGGSWRMPTTEEYVALGAAVNSAWTSNYNDSGIAGLVLTDKTDSSKELFFPASGYCYGGSYGNRGLIGQYWSSSLHSNVVDSQKMNFKEDRVIWQNDGKRNFGYAVRGVMDIV